ncbi:MAG: hypothetical protein NVSMB2_09740 [Chloroflexota bacterium]
MSGVFSGRAVALLVVLSMVVSGCGQAPAAAVPGTSAAKTTAAQMTIKLVVPHQTGFDVVLPMHVGTAKGFFDQEGLTLDVIYSKGGSDTIQAVTAGDGDIGLANGPLGLYAAYAKSAPVRIISNEIYGVPDVFFFVKGDSPIRDAKDLAGKKVGFSSRGSSTHLLVMSLSDNLRKQGLADIEAVPAGSPPDNFTAVKTDQIAAGWASPPTFNDQLASGTIKAIAFGKDIAGLSDITVRANFANSDFLSKHPEAAAGFLRAYQKAIDFAYANKPEATRIWKERAQLTDSEEDLLKVFDYYPKEAIAVAPFKGLDRNNQLAVEFGLLKEPLSQAQLEGLVTDQFLPK